MKNLLLSTIMALLCAAQGAAQEPLPALPVVNDQPDGACLRTTDEQAWEAIRLTTAQLKLVQAVQADFVHAGDVLAATDSTANAVDEEVVNLHRDRIKAVLTEVQYERWVQWCFERTLPEEAKP